MSRPDLKGQRTAILPRVKGENPEMQANGAKGEKHYKYLLQCQHLEVFNNKGMYRTLYTFLCIYLKCTKMRTNITIVTGTTSDDQIIYGSFLLLYLFNNNHFYKMCLQYFFNEDRWTRLMFMAIYTQLFASNF